MRRAIVTSAVLGIGLTVALVRHIRPIDTNAPPGRDPHRVRRSVTRGPRHAAGRVSLISDSVSQLVRESVSRASCWRTAWSFVPGATRRQGWLGCGG